MYFIITPLKKSFIFLIKIYQFIISPMLGKICRFTPTCSQYSEESIKSHGLSKGIKLSLKRLAKCHPWGKSGYDPVPD